MCIRCEVVRPFTYHLIMVAKTFALLIDIYIYAYNTIFSLAMLPVWTCCVQITEEIYYLFTLAARSLVFLHVVNTAAHSKRKFKRNYKEPVFKS